MRPTVVAVPARDEAERIERCLAAVLHQRGGDAASLQVLVLANNCRDDTGRRAARVDPRVRVMEVEFDPARATAGAARRAAMDAAHALLPPGGGLICTTDADSRPRPDWIARLWAAVEGGAQAVAGAVDFDRGEPEPAPAFSPGRRLEAAYSALQAEIVARLDPEPHNPWPNHVWAWGANLAVTAEAYRRVGGLPPAALAEDRAFLDALRRHDVPVRHCLDARVWTSARRRGRAPGGLASLVEDHTGPDREPCDAALEPAFAAARRALARRRARAAFRSGAGDPALLARLALAPGALDAPGDPAFGALWSRWEAASPVLRRRRLQVVDLPREVVRAERLLARLRPPGEAGRADSARAATAGLWSGAPPPP